MSFLPENEVRGDKGFNLAPMIDFLFLMVVFFAVLAVSRITTRDTEVDLVKLDERPNGAVVEVQEELKIVNISITDEGKYKWVTELRDYEMKDATEIGAELARQYERGVLPNDKSRTKILLKIDKDANWEPIMQAIFSIKDQGFTVHPVYQPNKDTA